MTLHPRQQRSRGQKSERKPVVSQPPTNVKEEERKTAAMFVYGGMWEFSWKREYDGIVWKDGSKQILLLFCRSRNS